MDRDQHTNPDKMEKGPEEDLFSKFVVPFKKSKGQTWEEILDQVNKTDEIKYSATIYSWKYWVIAASITILLVLTGFARFYKKTVYCQPGEHITVVLPDNSTVDMNSGTELSYHPLWWSFSRHLTLSGEALFSVQKGKKCEVVSHTGITEVLSTTFTVYSRSNSCRVTCFTGSVKVTSKESQVGVTLLAYEQAILDENGTVEVKFLDEQVSVASWKDNVLVFTSTPLSEVFEEIERQYNITLVTRFDQDYYYTGRFQLDPSLNNVLTLLCLPFDLRYVQKSETEYIIEPQTKE